MTDEGESGHPEAEWDHAMRRLDEWMARAEEDLKKLREISTILHYLDHGAAEHECPVCKKREERWRAAGARVLNTMREWHER